MEASQTVTATSSPAGTSISVTEAVVKYNAAGDLAFVYQVSDAAGSDTLTGGAVGNFGGLTSVDVATYSTSGALGLSGFLNATPTGGSISQITKELAGTGGAINMAFAGGSGNGVAAGQTSDILVVFTDSTTYGVGGGNFTDTFAANFAAYSPVLSLHC